MKTGFHKGLQLFYIAEYRLEIRQHVFLEFDKTFDGIQNKLRAIINPDFKPKKKRIKKDDPVPVVTHDWCGTPARKHKNKMFKAVINPVYVRI